ncbi:phage head closure protein [Bacillus velezensis]|uniref:phage head closure protein n=1 Tax=Bacillus amyloliquefaciens TaxID=1390 RepID=UPI0039F6827B
MGLNPGSFKNRIELQERKEKRHPETMKPIFEWTTVSKAWAEIMQPRDRWIIQAAAEHQESTVWFRIRYRKNIEAGTMRVLFKGQPFKIDQVIPDLQNKEVMTLQCVGWDHANIT